MLQLFLQNQSAILNHSCDLTAVNEEFSVSFPIFSDNQLIMTNKKTSVVPM